MSNCTIPPAGWACTREAGHDGPCAAIETDDAALRDRLMIELAYCRHVDLPVSEVTDRVLAVFSNFARLKALGAVHTLEGGL